MDVQPPQNYGSTIDYSNWSIAILEDDQESPHMASATFEHLMLHGYIRLNYINCSPVFYTLYSVQLYKHGCPQNRGYSQTTSWIDKWWSTSWFSGFCPCLSDKPNYELRVSIPVLRKYYIVYIHKHVAREYWLILIVAPFVPLRTPLWRE